VSQARDGPLRACGNADSKPLKSPQSQGSNAMHGDSTRCRQLQEAALSVDYVKSALRLDVSANFRPLGQHSGLWRCLQAFDAVLSVFAPCPAAELRRVLRPGGILVSFRA
jgi:hypothetical protein